jgi:hypothetical protein
LGDEIASETRKVIILNDLRRAFASRDRFTGAGKVMPWVVPGLLA